MTARWMTRWKLEVGFEFVVTGDQVGEIVIDEVAHRLAQGVEVDVASPHHGGGIGVVDQSEQQVLQRRIFMVTLVGVGQGLMQRFFEAG